MSSTDSAAVAVSRGASYLTVQMLATTVAQVASFAILARIITPSEVGILAILSLITSLSQTINGGAFQTAAMKYVGESTTSDVGFAAGVFYQTLFGSVVISIPFATFIFLGSNFLAKDLLGAVTLANLFQVLSFDILAFAGALPVAIGVLLGAKRFKAVAAIGTGGAVLRQCFIIFLVLILKNFVGLVYAWVISDFAMLSIFGFYAIKVVGLRKNAILFRKVARFSWPLSIGNFVNFAYGWFDRAILIVFVSLASLGVYNAALYAFAALTGIWSAFSNTLLPVYANINASRGIDGARRATLLTSRYVSLVMIPVAFGLFATAKPALVLFVGKQYASATLPLMVLSLAFALTTFGLVLVPMLTALAKTRVLMLITIISVVFGLGSAYILLPFVGIIGASIARGVATVVSLILTVLILRRLNALSVDFKMAWKTIIAGSVMAGVLTVTETIHYSVVLLPAYVILGLVVYLFLLRLLKAVQAHDIELIREYFGTRFAPLANLLGAILISNKALPQIEGKFAPSAFKSQR